MGASTWQRDGLKPPAVVTDATDNYLTGQDDLQCFIDDACVTGRNESDTSAHLWDGWTDWAEDHHEFVGTQRRFSDRLQDKGLRPPRNPAKAAPAPSGASAASAKTRKKWPPKSASVRMTRGHARPRPRRGRRRIERPEMLATWTISRSEKSEEKQCGGRSGRIPSYPTYGDSLCTCMGIARAHYVDKGGLRPLRPLPIGNIAVSGKTVSEKPDDLGEPVELFRERLHEQIEPLIEPERSGTLATINDQRRAARRGAAFGSTTSSQCPEWPSSVRLQMPRRKDRETPTERKENHMSIVQRAILRVCWQEEQYDRYAPRPWLRGLLTRVVGMTTIPSRKSEKSQLAKEQWLALRKDAALRNRFRDSRGVLGAWTNLRPLRR